MSKKAIYHSRLFESTFRELIGDMDTFEEFMNVFIIF